MDRIVILDFGSQTTHLIGRRVRDAGVYAEIVPGVSAVESWYDDTVRGLILSGSPFSVYDENGPKPSRSLFDLPVPKLGICYGAQYAAHLFGGDVTRSETREYGPARVVSNVDDPLFETIPETFESWMSHGDAIAAGPSRGETLARSENGAIAAYSFPEARFTGLQFHPEVSHSQYGSTLLANFARRLCGARAEWNVERYRAEIETAVQKSVGDRTVLLLISGGVDSTVVAALLLRALSPDQVHLMYVDTGLMRRGETGEVRETLASLGARHLHIVSAADRFYGALEGITDPEKKREIIGNEFIRVQEREIRGAALPADYLLAQGTLYTDLIESGHGVGRHANRIKSHHNVAAPMVVEKRDRGEIVEPLANLYKDEVRRLGTALGLPDSIVGRHPFPGPGLGVRVIGEVTRQRCDTLRHVDSLFISELRKRGLYDEIWQAFAVLLPVRAVGVAGDERAYGQIVALRAITSVDGMTADVYEFPPGVLRSISARITNEVPEVGRVVFDVSGKPPATIEWE